MRSWYEPIEVALDPLAELYARSAQTIPLHDGGRSTSAAAVGSEAREGSGIRRICR